MDLGSLGAGKAGAAAVLVAAAFLEVVGDALIRKGLRGSGVALAGLGVVAGSASPSSSEAA